MILVAKFLLHQPLNRQSATFAREGIEIDTSTLADRANRFTHLLKRMYFNGLCPDRISENWKVNLFISLRCSSDILLKTTLPKNRFDPEMRCVHMLGRPGRGLCCRA